MNKLQLQNQLKSKSSAMLWHWFLAAPFGYMGRWGMQLLFWFTLGFFGIGWLIILFLIGGWVDKHNNAIYMQIEEIEKKEKNEQRAENLAMIAAATGNKQNS